MSTSNLIRNLCKEKGISVADVLGVVFEQSYILENGEKLTITSES